MSMNKDDAIPEVMPILLSNTGMMGSLSRETGINTPEPWLAPKGLVVESLPEYSIDPEASGRNDDLIVKTMAEKPCYHIYVNSASGGVAETGNGTKGDPFRNLNSVHSSEMCCLSRRLRCIGAALYVHISGTVDYRVIGYENNDPVGCPNETLTVFDFTDARIDCIIRTEYPQRTFFSHRGECIIMNASGKVGSEKFSRASLVFGIGAGSAFINADIKLRADDWLYFSLDARSKVYDNCKNLKFRDPSGGKFLSCNSLEVGAALDECFFDDCRDLTLNGGSDNVFHRCTALGHRLGYNSCHFVASSFHDFGRCSFSCCTAVNVGDYGFDKDDDRYELYKDAGVDFCGFRNNTDCTFYNCIGNNRCTKYSGDDEDLQEYCQRVYPCSDQECDV